MPDWLAHRVSASPNATALIDADSGARYSYADLDGTVDRRVGALSGLGIEAGERVGTVLGRRTAVVPLVHATMRLGAVLVPLDPRLTGTELADRAGRAGLSTLVCAADTEMAAVEATEAVASPIASVDEPGIDGIVALAESSEGKRSVGVDPVRWSLEDVVTVLFTSGTTGRPKAVRLTAGNLLASASASAARLGVLPDDRWLSPLSLAGMGGLAPIYRSTYYGTAVVLQREFDAAATLRAIAEFECTGVSLVPTLLSRLLDAAAAPPSAGPEPNAGRSPGFPDSLRFVLLGGAPASRELLERCSKRGVPVCPTYGMTETASQVTTARPAEASAHPGTVGRPLMGVDVTVVDSEDVPVDPGECGELVVSGPIVTPGYDDPEASADAFTEHGFHTGDRGYRDTAGRLWVTGRLDDRIVTGGETVDPRAVAATLCAHPDVEDAAVVGLSDREYGERVGALVVGDLSMNALEAHCRIRLAGYRLPRTIAFADALPRTGSGTIDRTAVRERLQDVDRNG